MFSDQLSTILIEHSLFHPMPKLSNSRYVRRSAVNDSCQTFLIPHYAQTLELSLCSVIDYRYWNFDLQRLAILVEHSLFHTMPKLSNSRYVRRSAIWVGRSYIVPLTKSSELRSCLNSWGLDYVASDFGQAGTNQG